MFLRLNQPEAKELAAAYLRDTKEYYTEPTGLIWKYVEKSL